MVRVQTSRVPRWLPVGPTLVDHPSVLAGCLIPLEADLEVVVVSGQAEQVSQDLLALVGRQLVDPLDKTPVYKQSLPARHRVGSHDRVRGLERGADVVRVSPGALARLAAELLGNLVEDLGLVLRGETFGKLLVSRGEAVVPARVTRTGLA